MDSAVRSTPFWDQYCRLKAQHPDALLWTRMGDFYEMFEEDARTAARELHITLTSREFGPSLRVPLAGVPYHAAESYLARLIRKGYHVAICEQMSEAGRGLVEREVVRVVTPGTLAEPGLLPQRANNYLAALLWAGDAGGLAYVDVSTGEFCLAEFTGQDASSIEDEVRRIAPAECLTPRDQEEPFALSGQRTVRDPWQFDEDSAREQLLLHFHARTLAAFGCEGQPRATACAGAVLRYVGQTNPALLSLITSMRAYAPTAYMQLDGQTRRNLNLTRGAVGSQEGSLLATLDGAQTALGARLMRRWLGQPLLDVPAIAARQAVVAALVTASDLRAEIRRLMRPVLDLERITGRIRSGGATPRDVWGLGQSLGIARSLRQIGRQCDDPGLRGLLSELDACEDVASVVHAALVEPGSGRIMATGYSAELDALRQAAAADQDWMRDLEGRERARTAIKSLKVAVNQVFGYYIEVTNPNRGLVPADYVRKQTVAGAERYFTPELKEVEARLLRAADDLEALESRLFADLLRRLSVHGDRLFGAAQRLAELDVFAALAEAAECGRWVRPAVDDSLELYIESGRHPVVEAAVGTAGFIPNDCRLSPGGARALLITGPNMAGKSTYLRQVALITLLAQIGSFVPADAARVGLVDRIFTRVGAHDDLAGGASTFMVEMMETATICRQATARSLIVLDEVGRGTSSEDGGALAQAVLEHLHNRVQARTLFATHFRELGQALDRLPHAEPWTFAVLELSGQLAFTHRMTPGVAERSYGLQVARLAGLPEEIVARAQELLAVGDRGPGAALDLVLPEAIASTEDAPGDHRPAVHLRGGVAESMGEAGGSDERGRSAGVPPAPVDSLRYAATASTIASASWAGGTPALRPGDSGDYTSSVLGEPAPVALIDASPDGSALALLCRDLERLDLARTTPLQALLKLAEVQQALRTIVR